MSQRFIRKIQAVLQNPLTENRKTDQDRSEIEQAWIDAPKRR